MLNGQCTQAVKNLTEDRAPLVGFCSTKGRLIASGRVFAMADGARVLLPKDSIERVQSLLAPFARLARVTLEADHLAVAEVIDSEGLTPGERLQTGDQIRIGEHGGTAWVLGSVQRVDANVHRQRLEAGLCFVGAAIADRFLPQQLHYPLLQGVSFNKGCYTGQEVVARLEHLGKVKRYAQRFDSTEPLQIGSELVLGAWTGEVADAVTSDHGTCALIVIDAQAASPQLRGMPFPILPVVPRQRP